MDPLTDYRSIVRDVLEEYARFKPSYGDVATEVIEDLAHDHFELLHVGWHGQRRIHGSVIHIDIVGDKVWVQHDGTSRPVAEELVARGIPRDHVVLGFQPADVRPHTDFGVG